MEIYRYTLCFCTKSLNKQVFIPGTGSWDDTDEDEKTLKELRETFKTEKKKEQEAEELRLKLESQAEGREQCHHKCCRQYLFPISTAFNFCRWHSVEI